MVVFTSSRGAQLLCSSGGCKIYICDFVPVVERGAADGGANQADLVCTLHWLLYSVNDEERWSVAIQLYNEWMVGLRMQSGADVYQGTDDMIMV